MKFRNLILLSLITLLITSCASYQVTSDYERDVNFSSYQTYTIMNHRDGFPAGANPINKQRINRAINNEMNKMSYVASESPDLLVSWFVKVKDVKEIDHYRDYYGRWGWRVHHHVDIYEYQEGTLVIDLVDRINKRVIWHGKTSGRVYEGMPDVDKKIKEAVAAMFKQYRKDVQLGRGVAINYQ